MSATNRRTARQWAEIITQYRASGLSDTSYCRKHGLTLRTFRQWKYRCRAAQPKRSAQAPGAFVEIVPAPQNEAGPLRICLDARLIVECPVGMPLDAVVRLIEALRDGR